MSCEPFAQHVDLMHARDLVELSGLAAVHGSLVMSSGLPLAPECLERYWSASKCRLDRWGRALKRLSLSPAPADARERRRDFVTLTEILTSEILTRVWAAILVGHDRHIAHSAVVAGTAEPADNGAVGRSVLVGHLEARHRALSLLVNSPDVRRRQAAELDRLRRAAESWSDLLVGLLSIDDDLTEFGADPRRAAEFAHDFREAGGREQALLMASLRSCFSHAPSHASDNADLNAEIASSIVGCFPAELFDSTGLLRSVWMSRLTRTAAETQGLIASLFDAIPPARPPVARGALPHASPRRRFPR